MTWPLPEHHRLAAMVKPGLMAAAGTRLVRDTGSWDGLRLLGIDIGGTNSRARLWARGQIAAESQVSSASLPAVGPQAASSALAALLSGVDVGPGEPVDAVCVGSAGLSVPGAREFLHGQLAPLTRYGTVVIVSDAMLVLPAAGLDAGVAVICGTGSVAVGSCGDRTVQAGGWGYLLGDPGSGYWIVREALRVLFRRRDRGQPLGELGRELLAATESGDLAMLHRRYFEQPHVPGTWARYARLVLGSTDPAAAEISQGAARAVAELAEAATAELNGRGVPDSTGELEQPGTLPVVLAGGLFRNQAFSRAALDAVAQAMAGVAASVLADEPVAGAVRLAGLAAQQAG
jgi:glucosamine kinase